MKHEEHWQSIHEQGRLRALLQHPLLKELGYYLTCAETSNE
jgi:hypothetical protein